MGHSGTLRYGDTAVIFHWLIAIFIIGLLIVGKFMTGLDQNDPLRFELTQWHKSFGIVVLLLSLLRLIWRWLKKPPADPEFLPRWQKLSAHTVHWLLYSLMFVLPLSGWLLVSASPLNIDTVLFNVLPWPHIPLPDISTREILSETLLLVHEYAGSALILLLLAHVGAALKHHFIDGDGILSRMLPVWSSSSFLTKLFTVLAIMGAAGATLYGVANARNNAVFAAGDSRVSFVAQVTGDSTEGKFTESSVTAIINQTTPGKSRISASVATGAIVSENLQVSGALPDPEWFDAANHPRATFESSLISIVGENQYAVTGDLVIKGISNEVQFNMNLENLADGLSASGEFLIDRRDFNLGMKSQQDDGFVGFDVKIKFSFEILTSDES